MSSLSLRTLVSVAFSATAIALAAAGCAAESASVDAPTSEDEVTAATWLTISPKQCGSNPWEGAKPAQDIAASFLRGEQGDVDNFFRAAGIHLEAIGFAHPGEPMFVCNACQCPRGDTLVVKTKSAADAKVLIREHGFAALKNGLTRSPTQCGSNPWENEETTSENEAQQLARWSESVGAPLAAAGFVDFTEPRAVCLACQCPRGDIAVAMPKSPTNAARKLRSFGWTRTAN